MATSYERDLKDARSMIHEDRETLQEAALEMSTARGQTKREQMTRYLRIRNDGEAWKAELQSRLKAIGPEKPMALERAKNQVVQYALTMEKELAKQEDGDGAQTLPTVSQ